MGNTRRWAAKRRASGASFTTCSRPIHPSRHATAMHIRPISLLPVIFFLVARAKERDEKRAAELEGVLPGTEPDAQEKPAAASQAEPQDAAQATPVTAPKVGVSATLDATAAKAQNTETAAEGEEAAKEENKEEAKDGQAVEAPQQNQDTPETPEIPQTDAPAETTESQ